jgi:chromosome segregation protein
MLRRLELIGFKSFAERTRFEFVQGITAVVGPNGSGKSNIVDAVRWLLGEQSAKNLRGGEMTDVIFNGSSTRKSLGMAEVTMIFDNSRRILNHDSDQVQITRRVFRDGEGEYLINSQAARLKDIKELFLGSGAGHGAYSVIEQGRVDALLSASTKERRIIFEEAAGISRFKAKKLESLRKLENVDADVLRVNDILNVQEKQLKTLRQQASKAQRYQEYHARLRTLRISVSSREVASLAAQIAVEEERVATLRLQLQTATNQTASSEAELRQLQDELTVTVGLLQQQEAVLSECREQIARAEATAVAELNQVENHEAELLRIGQQSRDQRRRKLTAELEQLRLVESLDFAQQRCTAEQKRADLAQQLWTEASEGITELSETLAALRAEQFERITELTKLQSASESLGQQQRRLEQDLAQKRSEATRTNSRHANLEQLLNDLSESDADVRLRLQDTRSSLNLDLATRSELRDQLETLQAKLEQLREARSASRARWEVLTGLEASYEGVGAGVRFVLEKLEEPGPYTEALHGLVADLLTVPRDLANLIELALGDVAQRFVARDEAALQGLTPFLGGVPGRVGFLPFQAEFARFLAPPPLIGEPLLVHVSSRLTELPAQLLHQVWLVPDLDTARTLRSQFPSYRWVTRQGELLEGDGTLILGPLEQRSGLLSRKSELRELSGELATLDEQINKLESQQAEWRQQLDLVESKITRAEEELATLTHEAGGLREQILQQREVQKALAESLDLLTREMQLITVQLEEAQRLQERYRDELASAELAATAIEQQLKQAQAELQLAEQHRDLRASEHTAAQVTLSRVREQLNGLQQQLEELVKESQRSLEEEERLALAESQAQQRLLAAQLAALRSTATAAPLYLLKQEAELLIRERAAERNDLSEQCELLLAQLKSVRESYSTQRDLLHSHDLVLHDLQTRRESLLQRLRDEYGIDLATATPGQESEELVPLSPTTPDQEPGLSPQDEITELRNKLSKLGPVNLEALTELAEHERREKDLRAQLTDLTESRKKLQQIIDQINNDSRKLFAETIQQVREHFQELFRKLFAGGMADIILEDSADVLECGIEINVRPPGKETQRISLLSGGERALTAVALLLAIFRSRPSPFCLLDEVDAAMDEGNTQRLANLLREFSDRSQFIVITHKKRTMAAADLLYGVTMQESGVSKLVAVKFEDWPEESTSSSRQAA